MIRILSILSLNDLKSIQRDSLLLGVILTPWLLVISVRLLIPSLTQWLGDTYNFDLTLYYGLVLSLLFLINIPILMGSLMGFLLLDERDSQTLTALRVTPLSLQQYMLYRILSASLIGTLYILICMPLTGLFPFHQLLSLVPISLVASLLSPIIGLLLLTIASNKVEGLAVAKGFGLFVLGPLVGYFTNAHWEVILGLIPTYWTAQSFWILWDHGSFGTHAGIGLIFHLLLSGLLFRSAEKHLSR